MFDYYDDEDFCPQPDPPHIKQLIRDIDSILNDKSIKVFTDFDAEDGYNHIRINAFANVHIYNYETSFFEWDDTVSNVTLENLPQTVKETIDKIRKDYKND